MYHNQIGTLSSSLCQLRLGVGLRHHSLSPYTLCPPTGISWCRCTISPLSFPSGTYIHSFFMTTPFSIDHSLSWKLFISAFFSSSTAFTIFLSSFYTFLILLLRFPSSTSVFTPLTIRLRLRHLRTTPSLSWQGKLNRVPIWLWYTTYTPPVFTSIYKLPHISFSHPTNFLIKRKRKRK